MARCKSLNDVSHILLDGAVEVDDSDLDIDNSDSLEIDISRQADDDNSNSSDNVYIEKEVHANSSLSLENIHHNNEEDGAVEVDDSDLDIDNSDSLEIDTSGETDDDNSNSSNNVYIEKEVHANSSRSLEGVHHNIEEENESSGYSTESKLEFVDIDDVPELVINSSNEEDDDKDRNHEAEEEEHPHLVPVISSVASGVSNTSAIQSYSSVRARNSWNGLHNFRIKINYGGKPKKTDNPIFSEKQNKLYVTKDHPFKVLVMAENVPSGSVLKVTASFLLEEHAYEVLKRCPTHAQQDFAKGSAAFEHFVQSFSKVAVYKKNPENGQLSVSVMYEAPEGGEPYPTYLFKLTCFSSCIGGINRRPFILIFALEKDNIPLGRQTIEAKVCACPMRDFKLETLRLGTNDTSKTRTATRNNSKVSSQSNTDKYSITVTDPNLYLFLKQMKVLYETNAMIAADS